MELTPLRYFRVIAREGHLTRAAESLGVSQPALSAVVKKLEAEAGAALLERSGRGVTLTEAGRAFLRHADESVRSAEAALRAVREVMGLERGAIRVGGGATATSCLLPAVISAFRGAHRGLRFYVREAGSTAVAAAVLAGELDLGIVTLPVALPGAGDLVRVPLVEDELRLILPPGPAGPGRAARDGARTISRPAGRSRSVRAFRWQDLTGEPVIGFEAGSAVRGVIDRAAAAAGVRLDYVMELRSIEGIKSMVAAGIGVGFVSRFALAAGEGLACDGPRLARALSVVRRRDRDLPPAAAAFDLALHDAARGWRGGGGSPSGARCNPRACRP